MKKKCNCNSSKLENFFDILSDKVENETTLSLNILLTHFPETNFLEKVRKR